MTTILTTDIDAATATTTALVKSAIEQATTVSITCQPDLDTAGEYLTTVLRPLMAQADDVFDPLIKAAHASYKAAIDAKRRTVAPLIATKSRIDAAIAAYHRQVQLQREAERRRIEEQSRANTESLLIAQAEELIAAGDDEAAADVLAALGEDGQPPTSSYAVAALPAITAAPRTAGVSVRESWDFEIVDGGKLGRDFTLPDMVSIRRVVTAMGEKAVNVVGAGSIRVFRKSSVASRSRT